MEKRIGTRLEASVGQEPRQVTAADLPLYCPPVGAALWELHPRVYLPIEHTGAAYCPYCGAKYVLNDASAAAVS